VRPELRYKPLMATGKATPKLKVYQYTKCSTCRKALRWLDAQEIAYEAVPIVETPPTAAVLKQVLKQSGLPLTALFNTSGESYRAGGFKERLPNMSEAEAIAALAEDGKLVKRPLLIGPGVSLVGFDEAAWKSALR
jgi:arsenate reductase